MGFASFLFVTAILLEGVLVSENDQEVLQQLSDVSIGKGELLEAEDILAEEKFPKRRQNQ